MWFNGNRGEVFAGGYYEMRRKMMPYREILIMVGVVAAWFVMMKWVLPKLGVKT